MRWEAENFTLTTVFPQELNPEGKLLYKGRPTSKRAQYSYTHALRQWRETVTGRHWHARGATHPVDMKILVGRITDALKPKTVIIIDRYQYFKSLKITIIFLIRANLT